MRISRLSAREVATARAALAARAADWDAHFSPGFTPPGAPPTDHPDWHPDWAAVTEHVARAERVAAVLRADGLAAARARFAGSGVAIEAATLAAAALEDDALDLDELEGVLRCAVDAYVFYAPFLELLVERGRDDLGRVVARYEAFVAAYAPALAGAPDEAARLGAVHDALADVYVTAGRLDQAEALFLRRHEQDAGDVAVALSASRAFLARGAVAQAVRWLGRGAGRAEALGRAELAGRLRQKEAAIRRRLS